LERVANGQLVNGGATTIVHGWLQHKLNYFLFCWEFWKSSALLLKIHKSRPRFFLCIFSSIILPEETCFQQGSSATEGTSQPVTISKKCKNPSSALCMKRTWVQALQRFSTCSLSLLVSGTDLKSRKGLYSGPSPIPKNSDCRQLEIGHSPTTGNCIRCYPADHKDSRRNIVQHSHLIFNIPYQLKNPKLKTHNLNLKFLIN
jgi:hypothetical protein